MAACDAHRRRVRLYRGGRRLGRLRAGQPAVGRPAKRVLVLEAGGRDNWIWFHIPVGYLFAIGNPRADWMFKTEAEPGLNGRALNYPRGKVIGGSSAINGMIYMLGQSADYDNWRQLGLPGWSWDDVRPFFRKHVDHFSKSEEHGQGGEWRVEQQRLSWEILEAFRQAAIQYGIPAVADFNTGDNEGICYFHVNQKRGRRWSAARGFLKPVLHRPNLRLETGCLVEAHRVQRQARDRRALAAGRRIAQRQVSRRDRARRRRHRLAADLDAVGRRPGGACVRARHSGRARQARRRAKPARPSAAAHHLQGVGREDAEFDVRVADRQAGDGARLRLAPARAVDHGAVAARRLHALGLDAGPRQHPVSRAAALARQVRRAAASVPGLHRQRHQCAADQPRRADVEVRRPGAGAGDPAELPVDAGGPAGGGGFDPRHAPHRGAAGAGAIRAGRISAGLRGRRR